MRESNPAVSEAVDYVDQIPRFSKEKHTVETVRKMLALLDAAPGTQKLIHVAGTNGKGSVCAYLSSILKEAGYSTAVFTSPHLISIKERFAFNGSDVEDELFLYAFQKVKDSAEAFKQIGAGHPSYFEFLFLMFMVMVSKSPVDYIVLETGLGGRLDATNCIEQPSLTIITSIGLDHTEYLGNTVAEIAAEKAGIIKAGVPVVYDRTVPEAAAVIEAAAARMGSAAWPVDGTAYRDLTLQGDCLHLTALTRDQNPLPLEVPFAAEYQAANSLLAFRAAELLEIPMKTVCEGIKKTIWPGRMEPVMPDVYLDGAHNEDGIREFAKAANVIAARQGGRKILLFAVVSDKEYREMAEILCREFWPDVLILTQIQYGRGLDIKELDRAANEAWQTVDLSGRSHDTRIKATVAEAFREALGEKQPQDTVFCAGSLYLIGEIKAVLKEE